MRWRVFERECRHWNMSADVTDKDVDIKKHGTRYRQAFSSCQHVLWRSLTKTIPTPPIVFAIQFCSPRKPSRKSIWMSLRLSRAVHCTEKVTAVPTHRFACGTRIEDLLLSRHGVCRVFNRWVVAHDATSKTVFRPKYKLNNVRGRAPFNRTHAQDTCACFLVNLVPH